MKQSKTTLKELTAAYRAVLRHGILCNAIALGLMAVATPAMAGAPTTGDAWVFGDVSFTGQHVATGAAAFGGRRLADSNVSGKYHNVFPKYNMVGQSFALYNSDAYFGPINLTLGTLEDGADFAFNWQAPDADVNADMDIAAAAQIGWDESVDSIVGKLTTAMTEVFTPLYDVTTEAGQTALANAVSAGVNGAAGAVYKMSRTDTDTTNDGLLALDNVDAVVDGATITANKISVSGGSNLTVDKQDTTLLNTSAVFYTNKADIVSNGVTTLNADEINIDGSKLDIKPGATLVLNPEGTGSTVVKNVVSDYGAITMNKGGSLLAGGESLLFDNNTSTSHGAALYFKDQTAGDNAARLIANNITFSNNTSNYSASSGGAVFSTGGNMSILGATNTFTGNKILGTDIAAKLHKRGGGAVANQSYEVEGVHTPIDADMVIGKEDGSSTNIFTENTSSMNGGAIMNRAVDTDGNAYLTINGTTAFENNTATLNGGAIYNFADAGKVAEVNLTNGTYTFTENDAAKFGGAIYNNGIMNIAGNNNLFNHNTALLGGAIENDGVMNVNGGTFSNNISTQNGGAIYNEGIVNVNGTTKFSNNKANGTYTPVSETAATYTNGKGGAIFNTGTLTVGGNFENNTALHGGAIYNRGALTISDGSSFDGNYANVEGGAIANYGNLNIGSNVTFNNNSAFIKPGDLDVSSGGSEMGAAIYSEGTGVTRTIGIGNNVKFTNNYSPFGNLYLFNSNNVTIGNNVEFRGNTSEKAASIRTSSTGAGNSTITIGDNAKFISNTVTSATGGAALRLYGDDTVTIGKGALVSDNTGTAIYNGGSDITFGSGLIVRNNTSAGSGTIYNKGLVNLNGSSSFIGNTAANAGAIYNEATGEVNLAGTHTFRGNKAGNVANDIHNLGALNIVSGTTTVYGGITGTGHLTIDSGAKLNLNSTSIAQNIITLNGEMTATLNTKVDDIDSDESVAQIVAQTFNGSNGTLTLTMAETGTYHVFGGTTELDAIRGVWNVTNADTGVAFTNSKLFDLTWNGGYVTAETKAVENIASENGIAVESAAVISNVIDSASNSSSQQMKELSVKLQEKLAKGDTASVEHATKAIHPETESVAQSVASSVQNTVVSLVSSRMAAPRVGRNGGDAKLTAGGVWAQGLFNKSKQNNAFSGSTRGIALGLDGTLNKHWTIGAGYSHASSDIDGSARNTEVDSNTVFVYGQYKPSQWYLNAVANYTSSDYSEKGTVIDDTPIFGDYSVNSFGGSLATGYDFRSGITPELGLRYMHVSSDDYANSYGVKTHMDDTDYLTGIFGAKYTFKVVANRHTMFMPQLNAGVKYDLLSDKNLATVTMPGVNAYTLEGERLNRIGGEFGIGLGVKYGNLEISANYDVDVREDYTSQTGLLKFRTNF